MNTKRVDYQLFYSQIIQWYQANPRDLPWRGTQDPYQIWLSEIILQQTRVAQGLPYYYKFVTAFPSVGDLALASEEEVLRLWQGLGYYSRARNLHFCAKYIWHELDGKFPDTYDQLLELKGVGSYTAAAIASFAFGEVRAVVDGNVFRVLARYFGIDMDIATGKAKKEFEALANQLIPKEQPAEFNQAMMDFGSRLCSPKNPDCPSCPLQQSCFAFQQDMVKDLPVKINKTKIRERSIHYYVIRCGKMWIWNRRSKGDIWEGLYDFPQAEENSKLEEAKGSSFHLLDRAKKIPKSYRHLLSHQRLNAVFSGVEVPEQHMQILKDWADEKGYHLVEEEQIDYLAKPKLIVNFLRDQGF